MVSDTPTPGQVAYMAYWAHETPTLSPELIAYIWRGLRPLTQASWEAAAQAVLDHADFPPLALGAREEDEACS